MQYKDITHSKKTAYRLTENERVIFFAENRTGNLVFELSAPGAEAHLFMLYTGKGDENLSSAVIQRHLAPNTTSSVIVKARLDDRSVFDFKGMVEIGKSADGADAHQECRVLLLSETARATTKPTLEIKNRNVRCSHAATVSSLNPDHLFAAGTRGITKEVATRMLADGFFKDTIDEIDKLKNSQ